jgi:hypothetical protein
MEDMGGWIGRGRLSRTTASTHQLLQFSCLFYFKDEDMISLGYVTHATSLFISILGSFLIVTKLRIFF